MQGRRDSDYILPALLPAARLLQPRPEKSRSGVPLPRLQGRGGPGPGEGPVPDHAKARRYISLSLLLFAQQHALYEPTKPEMRAVEPMSPIFRAAQRPSWPILDMKELLDLEMVLLVCFSPQQTTCCTCPATKCIPT